MTFGTAFYRSNLYTVSVLCTPSQKQGPCLTAKGSHHMQDTVPQPLPSGPIPTCILLLFGLFKLLLNKILSGIWKTLSLCVMASPPPPTAQSSPISVCSARPHPSDACGAEAPAYACPPCCPPSRPEILGLRLKTSPSFTRNKYLSLVFHTRPL
jgi:hypothetical protein